MIMNKYLSIYTNWRFHALTLIAALALILLFGDTESAPAFVCSKIAAIFFGCLFYRLYTLWSAKGLIEKLSSLASEED